MGVAPGAGVGLRCEDLLRFGIVQGIIQLADRDRLISEGWVGGDVLDALAVYVDFAAVAQRLEVLSPVERTFLSFYQALWHIWHSGDLGFLMLAICHYTQAFRGS